MTPERRERFMSVLKNRQDDITVVLENVFDPHNISAVMRTCDAVGIQDIYVLNNKIPVHKKWGIKSSSSARRWVTVHQFIEVEDCFSSLRKRYSTILATHLDKNAISLHQLDLKGSVALIFGNEQDGVSEDVRKLADGNFIIPQVGMIRSLNISVACAVVLYEAYRQKSIAGHYGKQKIGDAAFNAMINEWGLTEE
jgi:tRNA (guanosine-2'-O-)-methyltransferase